MKNIPADWATAHKGAPGVIDEMNATWPRDGRETLYPPYEQYAPTTTVGDYFEAQDRCAKDFENVMKGQKAHFPLDFTLYLAQRVQSAWTLRQYPDDTKIDKYGRVSGEGDPGEMSKGQRLARDVFRGNIETRLRKADEVFGKDADDVGIEPCDADSDDACADANCAYLKPHKHAQQTPPGGLEDASSYPAGTHTGATEAMP